VIKVPELNNFSYFNQALGFYVKLVFGKDFVVSG